MEQQQSTNSFFVIHYILVNQLALKSNDLMEKGLFYLDFNILI